MTSKEAAQWMLDKLSKDESLYQEDVLDFLIKNKEISLLAENSVGNEVLSKHLLKAFKELTGNTVVWVKTERYWRFITPEDSSGRIASD